MAQNPEKTLVHALIPAAGCSRRLGRNKQLVTLGDETLLHRAARVALASGVAAVSVITGFEAEEAALAVSDLPCNVLFNAAWAEGLGGSLRFGVAQALRGNLRPSAFLVLLPDQAAVGVEHLAALLARARTDPATIVATRYGGKLGVPALFKEEHFTELLMLPADSGAKSLIYKHAAATVAITNEAAAVDVDTPEDLAKLEAAAGSGRPADL